MSFTFKDTVKEYKVLNEAGDILRSFPLDVGNYELLKGWYESADKVQRLSERMNDGSFSFDRLKEAEEEAITVILGADAWSFVWEGTNHNIYMCLGFLVDLKKFIDEQIKELQKDYV